MFWFSVKKNREKCLSEGVAAQRREAAFVIAVGSPKMRHCDLTD
jgi:hypothetical protein